VQKKCGTDKDKLYAMKITDLSRIMSAKKRIERHKNECYVHKNGTDYPFLVGMYYSFQTESKVCLMLGEYIKTIPDSTMLERRSKQYNYRKSCYRNRTHTQYFHFK
jgi:hypothetical protein